MSTEKSQEEQLNLKLKETPLNKLSKYRERFGLFRARWDIRKYTKSSWVWLTIILSLSLIITQIVSILESFSLLPKKIPLQQIFVNAEDTLTPTSFIYLAPSLSLLIFIVGVLMSNRFYSKERDLSNMLLGVMFLANLVITVALIRLINLY